MQHVSDSRPNALAAGLTGVALGALGVAIAYALTDRKTRDHVNDKIDHVKDKGRTKLQELKNRTHRTVDEAEESVKDMSRVAKASSNR